MGDNDDRPNSLLTKDMRAFVTGEKSIDDKGYRKKFKTRLRTRVAHGLEDLALLTEHQERIDPLWLLLEGGVENVNGEYEAVREGWRQREVDDLIPSLLTFIMSLAFRFNYESRDWEVWLENAYETVIPDGYATVEFRTITSLDLDELEAIFNGEHDHRDRRQLRQVELKALLDHGRIDTNGYLDAGGSMETY